MASPNTARLWTAPISFKTPGADPDVSIKLFHQEFQVHSTTLARKSSVFCNELSSARSTFSRRGSKLTYEWATTIKADGKWALTPSAETLSKPDVIFHGDIDEEIATFNKLLCAIYSWPFTIDSCPQLKRLVELADLYKVLPTLSIHAAFYTSPSLVEECFHHPAEILELAVKLRHPVLYRDCLMQCMVPWETPRYLEITDGSIRTIAESFNQRLIRLIAQAQRDLLKSLDTPQPTFRKFESNIPWSGLTVATTGSRLLVLPSFYEKFHECPISDAGDEFKKALKLAVEKRRLFDTEKDSIVEIDEEQYFDMPLYLEIDDKDLPWDATEKDW